MKKVLLVAFLLAFGSIACYSDSSLWVVGVTDTPPTATFLPTPDYEKYPAQLQQDEVALAPVPSSGPTQAFFFITSFPEDLIPGVRNASGSCEYGAELEVLYIGHQWNNFSGSIFIDDVALTTVESTEPLFDFESDTAWAVEDDGVGADNDTVKTSSNVNFNSLRGEDNSVDVSNNSGVLELETNFSGNDWEATYATGFDTAQDWSGFDGVTMSVFAPAGAEKFFAAVFLRTGDGNEQTKSARLALTPGIWNDVSFDISTIENRSAVQGFGIVIGPDPARTYYLVACSGTVGWASEDRIAGPIIFNSGQSAQTRAVSDRGAALAPGQPFMIHGGAEPPIGPFPAGNQCEVGEVVDVIGVATANEQIWYQIQCANSDGWVTEDRLFGPLSLPSQGGNGLIATAEGVEAVEMTLTEGEISDSNPVIGQCANNTPIVTTNFATLEDADGERIPYYQIQCGDVVGWTSQDPLLEIPYALGTYTIIVGREVSSVDVVTEDEEDSEDTEAATDISADADADSFVNPNYLPATMTNEPAPANDQNIIGECPSSAVVQLEDVASSVGIVFYQVTCGDLNGWITADVLPNEVLYPIGQSVYPTAPTLDANRRPLTGFAIDDMPSQVAVEVGQCSLYDEVQVLRVVFEERALARLGFRLYYQVSCVSIEGELITGWQELELHTDKLSTSNPRERFGG